MPIVIKTMLGLGDCLYLRPVLKYLPTSNIVLNTVWPQAFQDIKGLQYILPKNIHLHSQKDNLEFLKDNGFGSVSWQETNFELYYNTKQNSILNYYSKTLLGYQPKSFDNIMEYTSTQEAFLFLDRLRSSKPICLIRPNTFRSEWNCWARNPKDEYLQQFINQYRSKYTIISIANIKVGQEEYVKCLQNCDHYITKPTYDLTVGLFKLCNLVVCSPSFWLPLAVAFNKKTLCIFGASDKPDFVIDQRIQNKNLTIVAPNPFDVCEINQMHAFKDINEDKLQEAFLNATNDES